ncbi:hypothetical protein [Helicobacter sp. T3_23-1056]
MGKSQKIVIASGFCKIRVAIYVLSYLRFLQKSEMSLNPQCK